MKKHLKRAVRNENIRLKVALPSEDLPYLTLLWVINNGSEKHITVKRVFGCVYTRDKRILVFDAPEPVEKRLGVNLQQNLTIRKTDRHFEVEINFYPSIEFWISKVNNSFLVDGFVEVEAYGTKVRIPLGTAQPLQIDNILEATSAYRKIMRENLDTILKARS